MIDTVADMVNSIGIDTLLTIIDEINMSIKETPEKNEKLWAKNWR